MLRTISVAAGTALLTLSAHSVRAEGGGAAASIKASVPQTAAAKTSAELISRAERAFNRFVTACTSGVGPASNEATMRNLRVEIPLDYAFSSRLEDASTSARCRTVGGRGARVSHLWIYPTNDDSSVFVQYTVTLPGKGDHQQLALMEMHGQRITRLVSFASPPPSATIRAARSAASNKDDDAS